MITTSKLISVIIPLIALFLGVWKQVSDLLFPWLSPFVSLKGLIGFLKQVFTVDPPLVTCRWSYSFWSYCYFRVQSYHLMANDIISRMSWSIYQEKSVEFTSTEWNVSGDWRRIFFLTEQKRKWNYLKMFIMNNCVLWTSRPCLYECQNRSLYYFCINTFFL